MWLLGFEPSLSDDPPVYLWPLPSKFTSGNQTLTVSPDLSLYLGSGSLIVRDAFERYRGIIFKHSSASPSGERSEPVYDITNLSIIVHSDNEELQLGTDESYSLFVTKNDGLSIVGQAVIEASSVYGALRGLETFSQLCTFDYETKTVKVYKAPWYIRDKPRFVYRGLLLDTSRHYLPIDVIKQIIEAMSYAKLSLSSKVFLSLDDENRVLDDMRKIFPFELFHLGGDEKYEILK
ncbi:hypothetical protein RJ639_016269 [Escallonia herrerae]|uniref:beta-N-acetylhexosaminidase n=1 Tax=Escallonia herrerae TaxID=1293975 RepID=A0AA89AL22_9ASTE|nr:hypothetical protein RJ639_016269 [Escallonia herrerae]